MKLRSIEQMRNVEGKRVFLRAALDVPLAEVGGIWQVASDQRLKSNLKTLNFLLERKSRIILAGYLDRPGGKYDSSKSSKPIAAYYQKYFPVVKHVDYCIGEKVEEEVKKLLPGQVLVLENLRFLRQEDVNDEDFARSLANLADFYVNEAFSNCHRASASVVGITNFLIPYAGFHLQEEVQTLSQVLKDPRRPLVVIIGGVKIETKLPVIKNFLNKADKILVGGMVGCQKEILEKIGQTVSFYCGQPDLSFNQAKEWAVQILQAKTIVWNGPLGDVSKNQFLGTELIAQAVIEATQSGAQSIVGGGDTEDFLRREGFDKNISFISTGGGAMLEFLAGKKLPGLLPLKELD